MSLVNTLILLIGVTVAFSEAQSSGKYLSMYLPLSPYVGRPTWESIFSPVDSHLSWSPHSFGASVRYSPSEGFSGNVWYTFSFRRRRDVESAPLLDIFKRLDKSEDSFVDICEWTAEGGSLSNFMEFLRDDDTDGDERISFEEFPKLEPGDDDKGENADGVETTTKA